MGTVSSVDTAVQLLASMRMMDLSHTIEEGMPVYPTHPQYFHMKWNTGDPANMYQLLIGEHAGTHLDAPLHFYGDPHDGRCIPVCNVPLQSFMGRAVKLDFSHLEGAEELAADDIRQWEEENVALRENDAAVFYFGVDCKWATLPQGKAFLERWPGLTRGAAEYLAERQVRMACTDCLGIDGSATRDLGVHFALLERRILIVEGLQNLDRLPQVFLLITLPLKIKDGSGSPIRAIALF